MEDAKNIDTSSTSTEEPGDGRRSEGDSVESLDQPLADEHVHTQEQRNQEWTTGPGRQDEDPLRSADSSTPPTLDRSSELEGKLDDVMANPHSDAQEGGGAAEQAGGNPATD